MRSAPEYGRGRSKTPYTTLKIAVVAPIASASVNTMMALTPGFLPSTRAAYRKSCQNPFIFASLSKSCNVAAKFVHTATLGLGSLEWRGSRAHNNILRSCERGIPMKRILAVVLLAFVTPHPALGLGQRETRAKGSSASDRRSQKRQVEQALRTMTSELIEAYPKQEVAILDRILADDLTVINPDGSTGDKAGEIGGLRSGKLKLESVTNDDMKVRIYGETAVVTGRATIKGQIDGQEIRDQNRYTSVFVRRRGRWQVIALHVTRVAQQ